MINVKTDFKIASDSPDHLVPTGTARDNSTNDHFVEEVCKHFFSLGKETFNFLDLGCSGGQLVIDFLKKNNLSVGLEGSDYSANSKRANWSQYYNKNLFTCDITKPYSVESDGETVKFDVITAWEVIEHIHRKDLKMFFKNISENLKDGGIFLGSINVYPSPVNGVELHQTIMPESEWMVELKNNFLLDTNLKIEKYDFKNVVRREGFPIKLIKDFKNE